MRQVSQVRRKKKSIWTFFNNPNKTQTNKYTTYLKSTLTNLILMYYRNNTKNDTAFKRKTAKKERWQKFVETWYTWWYCVVDGRKRENMNICIKSHRAAAQRVEKKREWPGKTEQEGQEVEGRCTEGDKRRHTTGWVDRIPQHRRDGRQAGTCSSFSLMAVSRSITYCCCTW